MSVVLLEYSSHTSGETGVQRGRQRPQCTHFCQCLVPRMLSHTSSSGLTAHLRSVYLATPLRVPPVKEVCGLMAAFLQRLPLPLPRALPGYDSATNDQYHLSWALPERAASPGVVVPPVADMEVEEGEASTTDMIPESQVAYEQRFKRPPDVPTEQLEREMNEEVEGRMDSLETGLYWSDSGQPVLSSIVWSLDGPVVGVPAASPDMFDGSITSIQFNGQTGHQSEAMQLGGSTIRLWRPDEVIDDSTLASLDAQLGYEGMMEEIRNLNDCGTGETMSESQVTNLKQKYPSLRLITCRWVSAYKSEERVRCRIVAKDIKRGTSARSLGFSSPTPSIEGLHATLTLASIEVTCFARWTLRMLLCTAQCLKTNMSYFACLCRSLLKVVIRFSCTSSVVSTVLGMQVCIGCPCLHVLLRN